jgi:hypothetical protein
MLNYNFWTRRSEVARAFAKHPVFFVTLPDGPAKEVFPKPRIGEIRQVKPALMPESSTHKKKGRTTEVIRPF